MKKLLLFLLSIIPYIYGYATITVDVGKSATITCKATAPDGYIDHVFFYYTDPDDANYVALGYNSADCQATIYGLQAKANIKIEVVYTYTYIGMYDNRRHVGSGSYYEYITVNHSLVAGTPYKEKNEEGYYMWFLLSQMNNEWFVATCPTNKTMSCFDSYNVEGKITIPSTVQGFPVRMIAGNSFFCCFDITEVVIPSSVREIGADAFYNCGLEKVVCLSKTPPTDYTPKNGKRKSAFYGCTSSATLFVPKGCKTKYQNADGWKEFSTIKEIGSDGVVVNSVKLDYDKLNLNIGDSQQLTSTVSPSDATDGSCEWTSSNTNVATVTSNGYVLATGAGTATITCAANDGGGAKAECTVVVNKVAIDSLSLNSQGELLSVGETKTLTYGVLPANASDKSVTWYSDNTEVATVDNLGVVTAKSMGTAVITCTSNDDNSVSVSCRIKVRNAKVKSVVAGGEYSLILKEDGSLWACGYNHYGQLGDGTNTDRETPVKIMDGVSSVATGNSHTLILKDDGTLWTCGLKDYGQLGYYTSTSQSTPKKIMSGVSSIGAGSFHSLIVKTDGSLWVCGGNYYGELGDGTTTDRSTPKKVMDGVSSVAGGYHFTLIVKTDGSLWACGRNGLGQLGDGTTIDRSTPRKIMDNVSSVAAGNGHSLIVKTDGSLWACGSNFFGPFGDGTTTGSKTPIKIMDDVFSVASKREHSLIIKTDGSLWACGYNTFGQLGDGTSTHKSMTAKKIMDGVLYVAAGDDHSLIVKTDGSLWACGSNKYGQLGDGTTITSYSPKMIMEGYSEEAPVVELSNAGYATFYDSKNSYALPKGLSASVVSSFSNNKLEFKSIADGKTSNNIVPKGTAVMLVSDNETGGLYTLTQTSDDATYTGTNYLHGSDETTMTYSEGNDYYYKLTYGNGKSFNVFGWYWGNSNGEAFMIEEHRAWLALPKTVATRGFTADGYATGTDEIDIVDETGAIYDLQSRRIMKPNASGIYIKNGKKVLINKTK